MKKTLILVLFYALTMSYLDAQPAIEKSDCGLKYYDSTEHRYIYLFSAQKPEYIYGKDSLNQSILSNIQFNSSCVDSQLLQLEFHFIVDTNGQIYNRKMYLPYNKNNCVDKESLYSVLNNISNWIPGKCADKSVPVKIKLPISVYYYAND